ncbi:hypothetical protein AVEN_266846-1 [Araneus ventricosus]|uniref:Uncharacterized protein n=1 Tax=Araneus ventricosus TaxID=182803 RepID=A0A4Y2L2H9_ARAVE|nr:hypothetical protein AVEN_266846-1 [Araneus ventricosus]
MLFRETAGALSQGKRKGREGERGKGSERQKNDYYTQYQQIRDILPNVGELPPVTHGDGLVGRFQSLLLTSPWHQAVNTWPVRGVIRAV